MGTNVSTTFIQCPADPKKTLGIKLPFLVMIIKNVSGNCHYSRTLGPLIFALYFSCENISLLRSWCWMTRMCEDDSEHRIIRYLHHFKVVFRWLHDADWYNYAFTLNSRLQEWSRSSARCPWGWMKVGIRFSSICPISHDVLTAPTTSKLCEFRSMRTAVSGESTSLTDFTLRRSCRLSSNCSCPLHNKTMHRHRQLRRRRRKIWMCCVLPVLFFVVVLFHN